MDGFDISAAVQASFAKGSVGAIATAGAGYYVIDAVGGPDLDQLVAFDITIIVILANLTLTVP